MRLFRVLVTLAVTSSLTCAFNWARNPKDWHTEMRGTFNKLKSVASHNATFKKILDEHFKVFDRAPEIKRPPYTCNLPRSPTPPITAHAVRPADINVIASIGDSITAGFGITADNIIDVLLNDRHLSWVTGGVQSLDEDVTTITNILRKFNAGISGFSYAESWPEDREAGLNVAIGGETADGLLEQAQFLLEKMRSPDYGVDINNDWKLVSFMIGGNDLCRYCWDTDYYSPEAFAANIQQALDYLYASSPRTIVVLSNIFDITPLPAFSDNLICDIVQGIVCSCAAEKEQLIEAQRLYVQRVKDLIASGRYDRGRNDFTVVYMNHFDKAQPPKLPGTEQVDLSFWAVDCFHPGRKAHFAMATSLWNQLFEPVGQKREVLDWQIGTNLVCPSEANPYIKTNINSQKKAKPEE